MLAYPLGTVSEHSRLYTLKVWNHDSTKQPRPSSFSLSAPLSSRSPHGPRWLLALQSAHLYSSRKEEEVAASQPSWNSSLTLIGHHLITWPYHLQGRPGSVSKLGAMLTWQGLLPRKKENGCVAWQLAISVPGPTSCLLSLVWW